MALSEFIASDKLTELKDIVLEFTPGPESMRQTVGNIYHWAKKKVDYVLEWEYIQAAVSGLSDGGKISYEAHEVPISPQTFIRRTF